jgi:hypothetical protein
MCVRDSAIIGTYRDVQIAVSFVEQERHPDSDEARSHPWIVVVTVGELDINSPAFVKISESLTREVGGAGKSNVAASIPIDRESPVIEPRFGHDDGG